MQGGRHHGADPVVDHYAVHAVADGGDARDGAGQAVRPVPRAGAARVRGEAGPLDRRAAAAGGGGGPQHRLHGHRRPVPAEVPRRGLRRQVQGHQAHLLHHDLRLLPLRALPAPQLPLHLRRLPRRRRHVALVYFTLLALLVTIGTSHSQHERSLIYTNARSWRQLLDDRVGRVGAQGEVAGGALRLARDDDAGEGVRLLRRARGRGVRLRRAQRGAGDPGHHPVDAGQAVQETHVEGCHRRLHHRRRVLLPCLARRLLGLRQQRQ